MQKKKGQAAMEFLMTYGWAILAAIIVIGVLAVYFRPSALTTTQVVVTAPWYGVGAVIPSTTDVDIEIRNNGGETLTLVLATTSLSVGGCAAPTLASGTTAVAAGETRVLQFRTCTLTADSTINADLTVAYTRPGSSLTLQSTGTLSGNVP